MRWEQGKDMCYRSQANTLYKYNVVAAFCWVDCSVLNSKLKIKFYSGFLFFQNKSDGPVTMYSVLHNLVWSIKSMCNICSKWPHWYLCHQWGQNNPHGRSALLPCRLVPDDEHRLTGRCIQGEGLQSVSLSLWSIMCLYVTLLSSNNVNYVLLTGFPIALTDSDALRARLMCVS